MMYRDMTRTQKTALLAYKFTRGERMTTRDIQEMFGYRSWHGALWLVNIVATVIPITKEPRYGGEWYLI